LAAGGNAMDPRSATPCRNKAESREDDKNAAQDGPDPRLLAHRQRWLDEHRLREQAADVARRV